MRFGAKFRAKLASFSMFQNNLVELLAAYASALACFRQGQLNRVRATIYRRAIKRRNTYQNIIAIAANNSSAAATYWSVPNWCRTLDVE